MTIPTSFLLLWTFLSFSTREIDGGYLNENGVKEGYYFWSDTNEFSWFRISNNTTEFGRGSYKLTNDSITLNFGSARKQFDVMEMIRAVDRGKESIVVTYNSHLNEPIEGLEITLKKLGVKAVTGKDGLAILDTKNARVHEDEVDFRIGDYRTYQQGVHLKGTTYEFKVTADIGRIYKENQTVKCLFKETRKEICLGDNVTQMTFRRVTRKRFMDLYHGFKN